MPSRLAPGKEPARPVAAEDARAGPHAAAVQVFAVGTGPLPI